MPWELYKEFEQLNLVFVAHTEGITIEVEPTLEQEIQKGQLEDAKIQEIKEIIEARKTPDFTKDERGTMWFRKRICVPDVDNLQEKILQEAHDSAYSIHPGSTKMYHDLKERYWCMA
jgi:TPP-dependent trihydroxycyclohexane-1,2-dione (THcHDO) dehydratase